MERSHCRFIKSSECDQKVAASICRMIKTSTHVETYFDDDPRDPRIWQAMHDSLETLDRFPTAARVYPTLPTKTADRLTIGRRVDQTSAILNLDRLHLSGTSPNLPCCRGADPSTWRCFCALERLEMIARVDCLYVGTPRANRNPSACGLFQRKRSRPCLNRESFESKAFLAFSMKQSGYWRQWTNMFRRSNMSTLCRLCIRYSICQFHSDAVTGKPVEKESQKRLIVRPGHGDRSLFSMHMDCLALS
jgi:hypothetical protein